MKSLQERIVLASAFLLLICAIQVRILDLQFCFFNLQFILSEYLTRIISYLPSQVNSMPLPDDWNGLLQRTKRSLLWRWNNLKPVGASCRDHSECGTNYCRYSKNSQQFLSTCLFHGRLSMNDTAIELLLVSAGKMSVPSMTPHAEETQNSCGDCVHHKRQSDVPKGSPLH